jgi:hypothetical protein
MKHLITLLITLLIGCTNYVPETDQNSISELQNEPELNTPFIYHVCPNRTCHDREVWITLEADSVHWDAAIQIRRDVEIPNRWLWITNRSRDRNNRLIINWQDLTRVRFRLPENLVSDVYLIRILNPDGERSNTVNMDLTYCYD